MPAESIARGLAWALAQQAGRSFCVFVAPDLASDRRLCEELAFFLPERSLLWHFPAWESLPYDHLPPHRAIIGERLMLRLRLAEEAPQRGVLITSLPAWLQRLPPRQEALRHLWRLERGARLDLDAFRRRLVAIGMTAAERVVQPGEFAVRGGVVDLWPVGEALPLRVELWDETIESIRRFDPDTQRSVEAMDAFVATPASEVVLDEAMRERFVAAFVRRFPQHRKHPIVEAVREGRWHAGVEALLPLACERTVRLEEELPNDALLLGPPAIEEAQGAFRQRLQELFALAKAEGAPVLPPHELYAVDASLALQPFQAEGMEAPPSVETLGPETMAAWIEERLRAGWRVVAVAHGYAQRLRMQQMLQAHRIASEEVDGWAQAERVRAKVALALGMVEEGFVVPKERLAVLTGKELLGQRLPRRASTRTRTKADVFASLAELQQGDFVVHEQHGIGRYLGLETIEDDGLEQDFLCIEYADAKVYLPIDEIDRLHRYIGEESPRLDRLRSDRFQKRRARIERDLLAMAHELVEIEARRAKARRPPYRLDAEQKKAFEAFVARFPFEETEDQAEAIDAVLADLMQRERPMDRIVCGDVGFGKTEVALRAAFVVAASGKQVAVVAPTTVLAEQHLRKFTDRFAGFGVEIVSLSRLHTEKEQRQALERIADGRAKIAIGTHRLLSDDVRFCDLGLVIVDEEQRFGVRHKAKLASLHGAVDLLTLSATPIPRTLYQTLSGLRDVSVIATAPEGRQAVRTVVVPFNSRLVQEAIRRELYRGGQVYYLHNHVGSIARVAEWLQEAIPEARIGVAHGKMSPARLDRVMLDFYEGRTNVLVCTTIIESGLDVPSANTLIVERADRLGLAQLHQLRGRVGRSGQQAFAYFFTPPAEAMTKDAQRRLQAIVEHADLGAGFAIARRDLELRGAGNLLGVEQSGHIEEVGLDLYIELLREAIAEVRGDRASHPVPCEVRLGVSAIIPADYVPQPAERVALYRRGARALEDRELDALLDEMHDRFGRPPQPVLHWIAAMRVRLRALRLRLASVRWIGGGFRLQFTKDSPIDVGALIQRVQQQPERFRLSPDGALTLRTAEDPAEAIEGLQAWLDELWGMRWKEAA